MSFVIWAHLMTHCERRLRNYTGTASKSTPSPLPTLCLSLPLLAKRHLQSTLSSACTIRMHGSRAVPCWLAILSPSRGSHSVTMTGGYSASRAIVHGTCTSVLTVSTRNLSSICLWPDHVIGIIQQVNIDREPMPNPMPGSFGTHAGLKTTASLQRRLETRRCVQGSAWRILEHSRLPSFHTVALTRVVSLPHGVLRSKSGADLPPTGPHQTGLAQPRSDSKTRLQQ